MGTALFTGVTGLKVHQRRLDMVASNIANVNTVGYRSSRMNFQDLFSQTLRAGSAPVGSFGGTNPQQIGLGVQVASIDVNHKNGSLITTGIDSDLAIQGSGFFVLNDGNRNFYTRDGSFDLNNNGVLIEPATGMRVQGFIANEQGIIDSNAPLQNIVIPVGGVGIVRATSEATLYGNLNSDVAVGDTVRPTVSVYDSLGTERLIEITFTKTANSNEWTWFASYDGNPIAGATGTIQFQSGGALDPSDPANMPSITVPTLALDPSGLTGPDDMTFAIDFSRITQLSLGTDPNTGNPNPSDVTMRSQDGFPRGVLESFNIGANGEVIGVFTNGLTRVFAQIAVANFSNVGGLSRNGFNNFVETPSSGVAQIGRPGTGGRGSVAGGVLESSNVDLGDEFSNLIITQRGYQANARTITTADNVLQETINLVR